MSSRVEWVVDAFTTPLVGAEQVDVSDIANAVRHHLQGIKWDIAVFITDLPRQEAQIAVGHRQAPSSLDCL
ncbi:hypothetical protein ACWDAZ_30570, partial [Streptomyces sp. NPDC001215]